MPPAAPDNPLYVPDLSAAVSTRVDPAEYTPLLVDWLLRMRRDIVEPILTTPPAVLKPPSIVVTPPDEFPFSMLVRPLDEKGWHWATGRMRLMASQPHVMLTADTLDPGWQPSRSQYLSIVTTPWRVECPDSSNLIEIMISAACFAEALDLDATAAKLKQSFRNLASLIRLDTGFITFDHTGRSASPYEAAFVPLHIENGRLYTTHLRGYYWGNLLTEHHIDQLGGVDRIRSEAPVGSVEDWSTEDWPALWLEMAGPISQVTDQQIRELHDYFEPLLIPPRTDIRSETPEWPPYRIFVGEDSVQP